MGQLTDGEEVKRPPSVKSVTHILQSWNLAVIPYLNKIQKIHESRDTRLEFSWPQHFLPEIHKFCYIKKYWYKLYFDTKSLILLTFLEFLKILLKILLNMINMVKILMMSAKMANPDLLIIKVFRNKGYYVIISGHDVSSKVLSLDSNYIVDMVIWPKFGNSSISMRGFMITSIL